MINIVQSDAVKWANEYNGPLFHALLCDPPYHLTSIVKRFGKASMSDDTQTSDKVRRGADGYSRLIRTGFMGQTWDGGDVAFQPETWSAFMKVLHPGAFGMAFASSRGWHRLAVAIEDAGFVIHPTIFGWLYGSGFPKATNIGKQIDKAAGAKRKEIGANPNHRPISGVEYEGIYAGGNTGSKTLTEPATDLAKAWVGHRYGLQALKPALEPIIVFQKPYEGKPIDSMIETGAGALNIDGGRIGIDVISAQKQGKDIRGGNWSGNGGKSEYVSKGSVGRWPANFILGDEGAANALDAQSGIQKGGFVRNRTAGARPFENNGAPTDYEKTAEINEPDGGVSRFFFRVQEQIDESDPVYYCSKASRTERNSGVGGEERPMLWSSGEQNPGSFQSPGTKKSARNNHPTVKPISLAKYLATLLLPPAMYAPRRLFVPFAGVASECIGASQALWEDIVGVEMEEQYCEIARARAEYWEKKGVQLEMFK